MKDIVHMLKFMPIIWLELFCVIAIFGCGLMRPSAKELEQTHIEFLRDGYQTASQKDDLDSWYVFWNTRYKSWCLEADPRNDELIQLCNSYKREISQKLTSHYVKQRKQLPELLNKRIPFDPYTPLPSDAKIAAILLNNSGSIALYVAPTDGTISNIDFRKIIKDAVISKGYHVDSFAMTGSPDQAAKKDAAKRSIEHSNTQLETAFVSIYHRVDSTIPAGAKSWLNVRDEIVSHGDYTNSGYSMLVKVCTHNPYVCYSTGEEVEQRKHRASKVEEGSRVVWSQDSRRKVKKFRIDFVYTENMIDCTKRLVDRVIPSKLN